ncbi:putative ribonuclease H-like domain-containing protein [Tanacetum coccineum]
MELENSQNNALAKLPILKLGEYEMWEIRIKQYFQIQDYALWEVIENGNSWVPIPVTAPESDSESLDSIFNRLQKLVSRLAILGVDTPPEDLNVKFLRSLPSEWDTHVVTDKSKRGFGYTAVPSPHPLILNRPTPLDLSYSGLEEFKQPKTNDDSLTQQPKTVTETSSVVSPFKVDKAWKEKFFHPANHVRVEEPQKARENTDALIIEDWVSDDEEEVESIPKIEKKIPTATKKESVKTVEPSRRTVRYAEMYRSQRPRGNQRSWNGQGDLMLLSPQHVGFGDLSNLMSNSQLNEKGFVDSGCSRHMSGNIAHLSDFKEFDGGFVTFGGGANRGRITGKGTIKTDKLDLKEVYFVKELKFNLFSVLQMCDKKNYVLFTDFECLVLSPNFKLPDENQTLLKISRQNNMYSFDMKNIVPKDGLTCLVAKATSDESIEKGIKREYSVARTPQQNGVAERKNMTLIEAARTMLADSNYPQTFWAEPVYKKVLRVPSTTTSTGSRLKACKKLLQVKTALELQNVKGSCRLAKRSMIRSLMYLTASRPDIMFSVCACARFQVSPKTSHLLAVKRVFRYLKGKPSLGLWYSKDSPLELVAYTDSDYAGATLDRKSTTGGCQFLGNRLISWQCKKQTVVATSTTEAEYVAAANCCGQVLWIQNQLLDYGYNFMNTVIYIDNINLLTKGFDAGRFQYLVSSIGMLNP